MPGLGSPKDVRHRENTSKPSLMGERNEGRNDVDDDDGRDGEMLSRPSLNDVLAIAVQGELEICGEIWPV